MSENTEEQYILTWEAPKIVPPEFKLYYDEKGNVVCYSCEKLDGNYIVIDSVTYAEGRPDIKVIDGKIVRINANSVISKLVKNDIEGISCSVDDISIIVGNDFIPQQKWKLETTYATN
jgi:hypothetical protein